MKLLSTVAAFFLFGSLATSAFSQTNPYVGYDQVQEIPDLRLRIYQTLEQKLMAVIPGELDYELDPRGEHQFAFQAEINPASMKLADYKIIFVAAQILSSGLFWSVDRPGSVRWIGLDEFPESVECPARRRYTSDGPCAAANRC